MKKLGRYGFTMVEILISMGIAAILLSLTTVNLAGASQQATLSSSLTSFVSDVSHQRLKAMTGDGNGSASGIYFEQGQYVLFEGSFYNPVNDSNFTVKIGPNIEFENVLFPASQVVFESGSGKIAGYSAGSDSVDMVNTISGQSMTIQFNELGSIVSIN